MADTMQHLGRHERPIKEGTSAFGCHSCIGSFRGDENSVNFSKSDYSDVKCSIAASYDLG